VAYSSKSAASRRRVLSRALGCSIGAMAAASAAPAWAACTPENPGFGGTVICTGVDSDGLVVSDYLNVRVEPGAQVLAGAQAAITSSSGYVTLIDNGTIDGGMLPGVLLRGAGDISIGAGGSITGTSAIRLQFGSTYQSFANVSNGGQLIGTAGAALVAEPDAFFNIVSNAPGATIFGISGSINSLSNAGTIEGGAGSAISATQAGFLDNFLFSSGTIRSSGAAATMDLASRSVGNEGLIENSGAGEAIAASGGLGIQNRTGGRIATAGAVAIRAAGPIRILNLGTIVGSVVSTAATGSNSTIDTLAGTIQGDLLLGAGDDLLAGGFDFTTGRVTAVTGTVDGGAGIDTVAASIATDTTIDAIALPTNFERLRIDLVGGAAAVLAPGVNAPFGIALGGYGSFTVLGDVVTTGPAFTPGIYSVNGLPDFTNLGSITANLADPAQRAIDLTVLNFVNSGSITANGGNGVRASSSYFNALLTNSGTITASGTALELGSVALANSGDIRSTGGTAVRLSTAYGAPSTNSGTISGASVGLMLDNAQFENGGTISGGDIGVMLGYSSTLTNLAGATISGGGLGIGRASTFSLNAVVSNGGTINGDVDLSNASPFDSSGDVFVNDGGTVNGSLRLGGGDDIYITDLGGVTGVTGSIDAGEGLDFILYRVRAHTSTALALPASFEGVEYKLIGDAALTLTAPVAQTLALSISGTGSADLTVDVAQSNHSLLNLENSLIDRVPAPIYLPNDLDVMSRGTLSLTTDNAFGFNIIAAVQAGVARFENAGTIRVVGAANSYSPASAIFGGSEIVNSGTITLDGAIGVQSTQALINRGSIVQSGDRLSRGVLGFRTLDNSGTIAVGGIAVSTSFASGAITNSGTIESYADVAIELGSGSLTNLGSGVVRGSGVSIRGERASVINKGAIIGDVMLGSPSGGFFVSPNSYVSDGGTLTGSLTFGGGNDIFLQRGDGVAVTGTIDGGAGLDTYGRSFRGSATAQIGGTLPTGFERELYEASGTDAVVTLTGLAGGTTRGIYLAGEGGIVNRADIAATVSLTSLPRLGVNNIIQGPLGSFTNEATITAVAGVVGTFVNHGTIRSASQASGPVLLEIQDSLVLTNSGTIRSDALDVSGVSVFGRGTSLTTANSGTITGGFDAGLRFDGEDALSSISIDNSGTITRSDNYRATVNVNGYLDEGDGTVTLVNSGRITATGASAAGVYVNLFESSVQPDAASADSAGITIRNGGTIESSGAGSVEAFQFYPRPGLVYYVNRAVGVDLHGDQGRAATVVNAAGGTIRTSGDLSTAIAADGVSLSLDNAGTISGVPGGTYPFPGTNGFFVSGAIQAYGTDDRVVNSGSISGSIDLGGGNDRVENRGTITGDVFLRDGDDAFVQFATGRITGIVDGGSGIDALTVDATGGGAVNGDQFVNFESFAQSGVGNVTYSGNFNYDTIGLAGGTITVAAGAVLRSNGPVTITGSGGSETVVNLGTISGAVSLGGGADSYTEGPGSSVGPVDGGSGSDTYVVALAGDRSGIGPRSGFERLGVTGTGTLSLALDQTFQDIGLTGTGIDLRLAGFTVGGIDGSDGVERVTVDGDIARISLLGGDDTLRIGGTALGGSYDGGSGTDRLALTAAGPLTLSGTATRFETLALAGGALTVIGTLGATGDSISFGDGAQALTIGNGGRLLGTADLGAGNDSFRLAAGGQLLGSIAGGAGIDAATLELTADLAIAADALREFETLAVTGGRTLTFATGASRFDRIDSSGGLTVASATISATQVQFGAGNDRFVIAGGFAGSADGGAGTDTLELSGGSATTPVAFQNVAGFESLALSGGVTTIAGAAQFSRIDMAGGRLIGLAGSTITAPALLVGAAATFGSAGAVVGNIAVGGTLSPGASPGTMTVTGNVSLASGSTTLLELTPTVSDRLAISGTLTIANGATLTLTGERPLTPGAALDLIVASGGISGSYTTISQPATILGFVRQAPDRIQLFGQFANAGFDPQVTATINYVNAVLTSGRASAGLIAAVPSLLTTGNAANAAAFARLNSEAYASATQIGIQNGLTLAKAARNGFGTGQGEDAKPFTFVQGLGDWRSLDGNTAIGTSRARTHSYGLLGGIGFGSDAASIGGFAGYLDGRQRVSGLGVQTDSDGIVAGLIGHVERGGFDISALLAYDGGKADTRRSLTGNATASSRYKLRGWVSDTQIGYAMQVGPNWGLKPQVGLTYVDTRRSGVTEVGGGAFSLVVAKRRSHATFVDGALTLNGGLAAGAKVHPWLSAGMRYQLNGQSTQATAGFIGTSTSFSVIGVDRSRTLATAGAGISIELTPSLDLFGAYRGEFGKDGTGTNLNGGLRVKF
jgi:uncharacterized protein YhjY with autotransporter beta-barrel domain